MNEWQVDYLYNSSARCEIIYADTIYIAAEKFRDMFPEVPSLAVYSIKCVK